MAASPNDELSDTHWLRADVDHFLVREAVALGAEYLDEVQLRVARVRPAEMPMLRAHRRGAPVVDRARAWSSTRAGRAGSSAARWTSANAAFAGYPATQALFSHFTGVARCDDDARVTPMRRSADDGLPYPMDDAALHHVFDGGWMWVLRFGNGVTSAGIAVTDDLAAELRLADGEPAWRRLLDRLSIRRGAVRRTPADSPVHWMPRLPWRAAAGGGAGLGDAAVGGGVRRSAVLDRHPADAARHRAAGARLKRRRP